MRKKQRSWKLFWVLLPVCLLALSACGGESKCGEGNDGVPTIISEDEDLNTFWVARLGVGERNQLTGPDPGHNSLVQAFFSDFTDYRVQLADRKDFSEACFVYTSRQVTTGESVPLGVDKVTIGGLVGGDLEMLPSGDPPVIGTQVLPGRAFEADTITFEVESANGDSDFPAFTDSLATPDPIVLTQLGDRSDPDLGLGPSIGITIDRTEPLRVEWVPGNGDYFEFKIYPGSGSDTEYVKLRCLTYDDGCLSVPAEALVYLVPDLATNFQLKVERHNFALHSIKEGDQTKAAAILDVNSVLEGTVLR
jgi:hypothetical protein